MGIHTLERFEMGSITAKQAVQMIRPGENPDDAYTRIFAMQCKPCDFRRWFSLVRTGQECPEISQDVRARIEELIAEDFDDNTAFMEMYPDYVTHGSFATEWIKIRKKKVTTPEVAPEVEPEIVEESVTVSDKTSV